MNGCRALGAQGLGEYRQKDPSVDDAADAVRALEKRAQVIRAKLDQVFALKAELATIDRMLAASKET